MLGPLRDCSFPITPGTLPILCEICCRQTKTFQRRGISQEVFHRRDRSQGKDRWMRNWSHRETGLCLLSEGPDRAARLRIPSLLFRACKDMVFGLHGSSKVERKRKSRVPQESRWGTWVRAYPYTEHRGPQEAWILMSSLKAQVGVASCGIPRLSLSGTTGSEDLRLRELPYINRERSPTPCQESSFGLMKPLTSELWGNRTEPCPSWHPWDTCSLLTWHAHFLLWSHKWGWDMVQGV